MELTTLAEANSTLFQGNASQVADESFAMLGLNEQFKFPIRRLVTRWMVPYLTAHRIDDVSLLNQITSEEAEVNLSSNSGLIPSKRFPDIQAMLQTGRSDGKVECL
jgi:hypothetical protein